MTDVIRDNTATQRYELPLEGGVVAYVPYRREGGVVTLPYSEVPPQFAGQGVGSRMVKLVLDDIRARGEKVVPLCSFIARYVREHPEYADLVLK